MPIHLRPKGLTDERRVELQKETSNYREENPVCPIIVRRTGEFCFQKPCEPNELVKGNGYAQRITSSLRETTFLTSSFIFCTPRPFCQKCCCLSCQSRFALKVKN